jgi:hypothetical protein
MLIHAGNCQDIRSSLQHAYDKISIADLRENIDAEKSGQKRSTVIKLLESAISKKQKDVAVELTGYQPTEIPLEEISKQVKEISEDASFAATLFLRKSNQPPRLKRQKLGMADFWFTLNKLINEK